MKKIVITIGIILLTGNIFSQTKTAKIIKEETLKDKDHDKTMFLITFKDGVKGKICQSPDGQYWVHRVIGSDRGPFSKEEAIDLMYKTTKEGSEAWQKTGATIVGSKQNKILVDKNGNKYYMENGKKKYVK